MGVTFGPFQEFYSVEGRKTQNPFRPLNQFYNVTSITKDIQEA